jgi:hypothetical protein
MPGVDPSGETALENLDYLSLRHFLQDETISIAGAAPRPAARRLLLGAVPLAEDRRRTTNDPAIMTILAILTILTIFLCDTFYRIKRYP